MLMKARVFRISEYLHLSPYQTYILEYNRRKYDLESLIIQGGVLYAPHKIDTIEGIRDFFLKVIFGKRVDLIGSEMMLVANKRRIRLYRAGCYTAYENGIKYCADQNGNRIKKRFLR